MVSPTQVSVMVEGRAGQRTYPSVEAFLRWLSDTHQRIIVAGGTLTIRTGTGPAQHPADLALRDAIGATSAGPCLA
jgi:hypothetical protein